jgi:5-methylcytosine-specific restriction endonuclease McrA
MDKTSQLDHIVARSQGGLSTRDNTRIICRWCNQHRGALLGGRMRHAKRTTSVQSRAW